MKATTEETKMFHAIKNRVPAIVRKSLRKDQVLYGGRAIDRQVLPHLRTGSKDFDVFTDYPQADAERLEKELDKQAGGDIFSVEKAKHPGTIKVKNIRGETVADFTKMPKKIKSKNILGHNIETLESMRPKIEKTLRSPANAYRRGKDTDNLNRIKLMKNLRGKMSKVEIHL